MADIYTTYNVTFTQVQACERLINGNNGRAYYVVASAQNDGTEYTVYFDTIHHALICNCAAGQNGRACWHRRAAQAHAEEYRTNRRLLQEKEEAQAVIEIAAEVAEDKLNNFQAVKAEAKAVKADGANAYNRPPFQFLR